MSTAPEQHLSDLGLEDWVRTETCDDCIEHNRKKCIGDQFCPPNNQMARAVWEKYREIAKQAEEDRQLPAKAVAKIPPQPKPVTPEMLAKTIGLGGKNDDWERVEQCDICAVQERLCMGGTLGQRCPEANKAAHNVWKAARDAIRDAENREARMLQIIIRSQKEEEARRQELEQEVWDELAAEERAAEKAAFKAEILAEDEGPALAWSWGADVHAEDAAVKWTIDGVMVDGPSVGILFGDKGQGKTFVALDLMLSVANGLPSWMGWPMNLDGGREVALFLGEGQAGIKSRIAAWLAAHPGADNSRLGIRDGKSVNLADRASVLQIIATLQAAERSPKVLVFDTLGLAMDGVDENDRSAMRAAFKNAKLLAQAFDALVLLVTHPGHENKQRPAGSSTQEQDADVIIRVHAGALSLTKQKEGELGSPHPFALIPVEGQYHPVAAGTGASSGKSKLAEISHLDDPQLLELLAELGVAPLAGRGVIEAALSASGKRLKQDRLQELARLWKDAA